MIADLMHARLIARELLAGHPKVKSVTSSGVKGPDQMRARLIARELSAGLIASVNGAWRWQLRDKDGRWIEMGTKVNWTSRGKTLIGKVIGSPKAGVALVEEDGTGRHHQVTTNRLQVDAYDLPAPQRRARKAVNAHKAQVMAARIAKAELGPPITAYPNAPRSTDGRVILTPKQLKSFSPESGPHSMDPHIQDAFDAEGNPVKVLSKQREAIHDHWISQTIAGVVPTGRKRFYFLGGGGAAGKTTATDTVPTFPKVRELKDAGVKPPGEAVLVDADAFKVKLPEWGLPSNKETAGFTHFESSMMAAATQNVATSMGLDVVMDGTGDGSVGKQMSKINQPRERGYRVEGLYVSLPTEEALVRSLERSISNGRYLPEEPLMRIHRDVVGTVEGVRNEYDRFDLFDTDVPFGAEPHPVVVDNVIVDQARWEAFQAKKTIPYEVSLRAALVRAEKKKYRPIEEAKTGRTWTPEEVKAYTIKEIQGMLDEYSGGANDPLVTPTAPSMV